MQEAVRDGMGAGAALGLGLPLLGYWVGFSAALSVWDALWAAVPWGLSAMVVGGFVQGTRHALGIIAGDGDEERSPELPEALGITAIAMAAMAWGSLKEAKVEGQETLKWGAAAVVILAALVFLLLVFAPSVLDDIRRAVARSF